MLHTKLHVWNNLQVVSASGTQAMNHVTLACCLANLLIQPYDNDVQFS